MRFHMGIVAVASVSFIVAVSSQRSLQPDLVGKSCATIDGAQLQGLDVLCSLLDAHYIHLNETSVYESHEHDVVRILARVLTIFLWCGECTIIGAMVFGRMVSSTPGLGLWVTTQTSIASTLAIGSCLAYHLVIVGWWLDYLDVLQVVCAAPLCQAMLTAAIAFLYASVVEVLMASFPPPARFC